MKARLLKATSVIAFCVISTSAFASDDIEARIDLLQQQINELKAELQQQKKEKKILATKIAKQEAESKEVVKIAAEEKKAKEIADSNAVKITMKPVPKIESADGEYSFQPIGRLHADFGFFNDDVADHPDGANFRRLRLGAKGKMTSDWQYKVEVDFAKEDVALKDAYIAYTGWDDVRIWAGHSKSSFTFDNITSSNFMVFIENPLPVAAFARGEIFGINAGTWGENWTFNAGVFNDDAGVTSSDDEAWSFVSRATFAPILDEEKVLHVGASISHRNPDNADDSFRFRSKAENGLATLYSVDTGNITDSDRATLYGLELAGAYKSAFAEAEYIVADVNRNGASDPSFSGYYAQVGYILTGETRKYNNKKGLFGRVKPKNPFSLNGDGNGAFEIAIRYSSLDLTDAGITGGEMDDVTLGMNWYVNDHIRFMANYIIVDSDENSVTPNDSPNILLFRGQVDF